MVIPDRLNQPVFCIVIKNPGVFPGWGTAVPTKTDGQESSGTGVGRLTVGMGTIKCENSYAGRIGVIDVLRAFGQVGYATRLCAPGCFSKKNQAAIYFVDLPSIINIHPFY